MRKDLRDKIKRATEESGIEKPDFVELLNLIDAHYDHMEATITQSLTNTTPIEAIFDSVAEALLSVSESGIVCNCNKTCSSFFGLTKDQLIGSKLEHLLPSAKGKILEEFLQPFLGNLEETHPEREFVLIIGGDNLAIFHNWKASQQILRSYPVYVYRRPGYSDGNLSDHPQICFFNAPLLEISASNIRKSIKNGLSVRHYVPDAVYYFLKASRIYH